MNIAIISLTHRGWRLSQLLRSQWLEYWKREGGEKSSISVYGKMGRARDEEGSYIFTELKEILPVVWRDYDAILCIMATGIVVRLIAPLLIHKSQDPAVLVMDERGEHVISLLSGHLGGANELSKKVARYMGARAVITTASDVNQLLVPDVMARELHLRIVSFEDLVKVNAEIVAGKEPTYYLDELLQNHKQIETYLLERGQKVETYAKGCVLEDDISILITDRSYPEEEVSLTMYAKTLYVGIGCRRGMSKERIQEAVEEAVIGLGYHPAAIDSLQSVIVKKDEEGLISYTKEQRMGFICWDIETLQGCVETYQLEESPFVKEKIGVGNICEAALYAKEANIQILQGKTKREGITLAVGKKASM